MKKTVLKSISISLLMLMAFFVLNIFMPNIISVMPSGSGHDKCFSEQCGPIQHLFHTFIILGMLGINRVLYFLPVIILLLLLIAVAYPPITPPPRFCLIKSYY